MIRRQGNDSGSLKSRVWQSGSDSGGRDRQNLGPVDDFQPAVELFDNRRAAFHPIATIDVSQALLHPDDRVMDMAANNSINAMAAGFAL
jgi:hypothetical protein